jgi:hypothetical protein
MRSRYKVKDVNGMTIGAATSQARAVAVAQQVQGASYIYDAKTGRSFSLDGRRALDKASTPAEAAAAAKAFVTRTALLERIRMTDQLKALLAIFSDDELLWFRGRLNNEVSDPADHVAQYRLIEAISNELIERGLIK